MFSGQYLTEKVKKKKKVYINKYILYIFNRSVTELPVYWTFLMVIFSQSELSIQTDHVNSQITVDVKRLSLVIHASMRRNWLNVYSGICKCATNLVYWQDPHPGASSSSQRCTKFCYGFRLEQNFFWKRCAQPMRFLLFGGYVKMAAKSAATCI